MKRKMKDAKEDNDNDSDQPVSTSKRKRKKYDGIGPERMPDEFFDENGDFNLSKVKGEQARQYFERVLRLPMPPNMIVKSTPADEGKTKEMRTNFGISGERPVRQR